LKPFELPEQAAMALKSPDPLAHCGHVGGLDDPFDALVPLRDQKKKTYLS